VRVPDEAGLGKAKVTFSLKGWIREVASCTVEIPVVEAKKDDKEDKQKTSSPRVQNENGNEDKLREECLSAKTSKEAGAAYAALFKNSTKERLRKLKDDPDIGIALQAAWGMAKASDSSLTSLHRFLGFLEGRIGSTVPISWEADFICSALWRAKKPELVQKVLAAYAPIDKSLWKDQNGDWSRVRREYRYTDHRFWIPKGTKIDKQGNRFTMTSAEGSIGISTDLVREISEKYSVRNVLPVPGPENSFVAFFDQFGSLNPLICFDSRTGKLLWQAEVWALGGNNLTGPLSGAWIHDVTIELGGDKVFVFGRGNGRVYVEAFDRRTGRNHLRVTTHKWYFQGTPAHE